MNFYKLILSYDGTHYFGWQKTRTGASIQGTLEKAIAQISKEAPSIEAASRTDRGVHAKGQVAHLSLSTDWEPKRLLGSLNGVLPVDIRILEVEKTTPDFHPTLHAVGKEYRYQISTQEVENPLLRLYAWTVRAPLNLHKMERASNDLLGTHNFTAFANEKEGEPRAAPTCTLTSIAFIPSLEGLQIRIRGDRFLYKMVRNLVGTLIYIGCGKLPPDCIPLLLASLDRKKAGITAPAHGLFLHKVLYANSQSE
jgi:tRNA pseudouridine38-40 synthase